MRKHMFDLCSTDVKELLKPFNEDKVFMKRQ